MYLWERKINLVKYVHFLCLNSVNFRNFIQKLNIVFYGMRQAYHEVCLEEQRAKNIQTLLRRKEIGDDGKRACFF